MKTLLGQDMANCYLDGMLLPEIYALFSTNKEDFIAAMEARGLRVTLPAGGIPQKRGARVLLALRDEALKKREDGMSHEEIAVEYEVSTTTVHRYLGPSPYTRERTCKYKRVDGEKMRERNKLVYDVLVYTKCAPKLLAEVFDTGVSNIYCIKRSEEKRRGET